MAEDTDELPPDLIQAVRQALGYTEGARWARAGQAWSELVDLALDHEHLDLAREAANRAVDALRRDDRPSATLQVLRRAIALADDEDAQILQQIQLAACLLDAGHLDLSEQVGREVLSATAPGPLRALAADTLAGALLARGDLVGFRGVLAQLREDASGIGVVSADFRGAQLDRLDGRLEAAAQGFAACIEALEQHPGAAGARASACAELGELALLQGDPDLAMGFFDRASEEWAQSGRRAGLFQIEGGRALAALASGATTFLPGLLDGPVAYAEERGLPLLEARLRMARGLCRYAAGSAAADADLQAAILLADTARAPYMAGRVRYERHRWGLSEDLDELRQACDQLSGNQPWFSKATLALARALRHTDPPEALRLAGAVLCRFTAMGLHAERDIAKALVDELVR
ncbi:MAG: hypothetical protein H6739_13480 [Alphaproteobacteria bacterium]|nr:hypothetical protein [Alphaproteobacteria bacterium]